MANVTSWRNRIVGSGEAPPADLAANPRNWRIHPAAQQAAVGGALDQLGWIQQVIVNRSTGFVVDGHLRVAMALARGEPMVPVLYVELDEAEEALALATFDPLSAMAVSSPEKLAELMRGLTVDDPALLAMLNANLTVSKPGFTDPNTIPAPVDEPYVVRGEVYRLGGHRLMCGDSTDAGDVARLLAGEKPALLVTDPPYGVAYDPTWRATAGVNKNPLKMGAVSNDDRADWTPAWNLAPADVAYVWHGGLHAGTVAASLLAAGFEMRGQIVWVKDRMALSRGAYHWRHEPCWYAIRKGATASWIGGRRQQTVWHDEAPSYDYLLELYRALSEDSSVWEIASRDDSGHGHGTQKPVECMERPIRNHAGDVYDPFVGSGTTVIAAERQARRCFAMELEPRYAQVVIERFEGYTGVKAERES